MHHTGEKESKKEIFKKRTIIKFALRGFEPGPAAATKELQVNASIHWTTSVNADVWSLKEVFIPSIW